MQMETLFPDALKLDVLYQSLAPGSQEQAEAAAFEAAAEYRRSVDRHPSLATVRDVLTFAMFSHTIVLCPDERSRAECRDAFGVASGQFVPGTDRTTASEPTGGAVEASAFTRAPGHP